jgi:5'-methylthioadenosine phosphorylase
VRAVSGRLAVIGKRETLPAPDGRRVGGDAPIVDAGTHLAVYRHGLGAYVPAHRVDHAATLGRLRELGCGRVLAISSVGALRVDLPVGTFVAPDDFIALDQPPLAAVDGHEQHVVPGFTPAWRARVSQVWSERATPTLVDGGVYWQANGPRFETPAEIRVIASMADVVGMTVASECVVANQLGLDYAAVCIVDNLANGLDATRLTEADYARGQAENRAALLAALDAVLPELEA